MTSLRRHPGPLRPNELPPASRSLGSLTIVLLLAAMLAAGSAQAQAFAVGAGGSVVNDTGSAAYLHSFGTWGGHLFAEVGLDSDTFLQLRVTRFGVPGTASGAPNIRVDAGLLSVSYLFKEDWLQAGFFGGIGVYHFAPKNPDAGQTATDPTEDVFGLHGGILTIFSLAKSWDLRLEASGHLPRTHATHTPILISTGIAYRF